MDPVIEWSIPIIVGILTFFGGRLFERKRIANANRVLMLAPIEEWLEDASRVLGVIGDDLSALAQGLSHPIVYSPQERLDASKALGENIDKVMGILQSQALSTRGTKRLSANLEDSLTKLNLQITKSLFPRHLVLMNKMLHQTDLSAEIQTVLPIVVSLKEIIKDAYGQIAKLKTRLN